MSHIVLLLHDGRHAQAAAMTDETCLVTVMHSNNEVGAIQPIAAISAAVKLWLQRQGRPATQCLIHTDAAQSIGKVPVKVGELGPHTPYHSCG